jgi:DeoR family suf operon transcriptional repressor
MTEIAGSAPGGVVVAPSLPSGRRAVLFAVRRLGDASVEEVADALGITVSGARQHLSALTQDGLVATKEVAARGTRGRPRLLYHTTEQAAPLFPNAYGALANELLGYLEESDAANVDRVFARRRESRIVNARARLAPLRSFAAKVRELAQILDEDGYVASCEQLGRDHFRIIEHNCAIVAVAQRYGQACASELEFIRAVLDGARVERVSHIIEGARHCAYDIRRER